MNAHLNKMQQFGYEIPRPIIGIGEPINYLTPSDRIINEACSIWDVRISHIMGDSRKIEYVLPRHAIAYVMVKILNLSTNQVGKKLKRDHSTIVDACQRVMKRVKVNNDYAIDVAYLIEFAQNLKKEVVK